MADYPQEPTSDEQLRNLQDQVRRLWTRIPPAGRFDPVTDLEPLLCAGWSAPFAVIGEPPEHTGANFGAYRSSDRVYWRGSLAYDEGFAGSNPDPTHPDNDAIQLIVPDQDALGSPDVGGGGTLPQAFWPDRTLVIAVPADNENSVDFVRGRWAQLLIKYTGQVLFQGYHGASASGVMADPAGSTPADNIVLDGSARQHLGVPNGTYLSFEAVQYRPRYSG